jgi:predicted dehydrogenase
MLAEVNSHDLDTVRWFADADPVDISVRVANFKGAEREVSTEHFYDTMLATVTFESGALASIAGVCPADYGYDARVEVTCTGGMVQIGDTGPGGLATITAGKPSVARPCSDPGVTGSPRPTSGRWPSSWPRSTALRSASGPRTAPVPWRSCWPAHCPYWRSAPCPLSEVTSPAFVPSWQAAARSEA